MPVGPHILWLVKPRKSAPSSCTSTGMCGTDWAASTSTSAPAAWAASAISRTGLMVPSTLDWWARATSLVRPVIRSPAPGRSSWPSSVTPNQRSVAPVRSHSSCHGTMLEWCSISVMTISSPGPRRNRAEPAPAGLAGGRVPHGVGDQVDALGDVLGEHHLGLVPGADEAGGLDPGALVGGGGLLAELVAGPVDVGVVPLVEVVQPLDDLAGLLGGVRAVQVHQRLPVPDLPVQDREILADPGHVQGHATAPAAALTHFS